MAPHSYQRRLGAIYSYGPCVGPCAIYVYVFMQVIADAAELDIRHRTEHTEGHCLARPEGLVNNPRINFSKRIINLCVGAPRDDLSSELQTSPYIGWRRSGIQQKQKTDSALC